MTLLNKPQITQITQIFLSGFLCGSAPLRCFFSGLNYCHEKMPAVYGQVIGSPRRKDRANQFWQQSKHPVAIWSERFWRTKFDYLHDNPRRKGLVYEAADWRFSSAAYWLREQVADCDVKLTGVAW